MAQSDIIDIDQLLPEEELLLTQPLGTTTITPAGVPVIDKIYTQKSGDLVPADFKTVSYTHLTLPTKRIV